MQNSDLLADDTVEPVLQGSRFVRNHDLPAARATAEEDVKSTSTSSLVRNKAKSNTGVTQEPEVKASRVVPTSNILTTGEIVQELPVQGSRFVRTKNVEITKTTAQEPPLQGSRFVRTRNMQPLSKHPKDEYEVDDEDEEDRGSLRSLKEYMKKTDFVGDDVGKREWGKGSRFEKKSSSDPLPGRPVIRAGRSRNKRCSSLLVKEEKEEMDDDDDRGSLRSLKVFMASCDLLSDDGTAVNNSRPTRNSKLPRRRSSRGSDSGAMRRGTVVNEERPDVRRQLEFGECDDEEECGSLKNLKEFLDRSELMAEEPRIKRRSSGSRLVRNTKGRVPPAVERRMKREKALAVVPEDERNDRASVGRVSSVKSKTKRESTNDEYDDEDDRASLSSLRNYMATKGSILLNDDMVNTKTSKTEKSDKLIGSPLSDVGDERREMKRKTSSNKSVGYVDERRPTTGSSSRRKSKVLGSPRSETSDLPGRPVTSAFNRFSRIDSPPSDTSKSTSGDNASSSDGTEEKRITRKSSPRSVLLRGSNTSIKSAGADLLKVINTTPTEKEYSGKYCNFYPMVGCFRCRQCTKPLYSADAKFDARNGFPSFDRCYRGAVEATVGSRRSSLRCAACKAHLGHIVDGEWLSYTNERHSVVSVAISYDSNPCGKLETTLRSGVAV